MLLFVMVHIEQRMICFLRIDRLRLICSVLPYDIHQHFFISSARLELLAIH